MSIQTTPTPPVPEPGQAETYRPLSLLALGGLALALTAAAAVLIGGLVPVATANLGLFCASLVLTPLIVTAVAAVRGVRGTGLGLAALGGFAGWAVVLGLGGLLLLSRREPWVLPSWFWALAAGGAVLSWVARGQIKQSENTLSGEGLAHLGLLVSGGVALVYGTYVAGSMLAVQYQARACATAFLEEVQKGNDPYAAFTLTLPPNERNLGREHIEQVNNTPTAPNEVTQFTAFTQGALFRMIQMGGGKTTFEERGLTTDFEKGNYHVLIQYRGRSPYYTFDFEVRTEGKYSDTRRVWTVVSGGTKISETTMPVPTALGEEMGERTKEAGPLLDAFLLTATASEKTLGAAYLLTLPPAEREGKGEKEALAALKTPGGKKFTSGEWIDLRDALFVPTTSKGPMTEHIKKLFDLDVPRNVGSEELRVYNLMRLPRLAPSFTEDERGWKMVFPVRLIIRDAFALPKYIADLDLSIEGTKQGEARVTGLKLVKAMLPPPDKKGPSGAPPR
jgi:hypothetical protein